MAAAMKEVLVCLGERKRGVSFASGDPDEEREALLQAIVEAFVDVKIRDDLVLQLKSEEWGGEFVDLKANQEIPDRAVLKVVSEVCYYSG